MTWAIRRQIVYIFILIVFLLACSYMVARPYINRAPTCFDGRQNGNETGTDCGGSCALACLSQVDKLSVIWARTFPVVPGRYNAVAYLENHNKNTAVVKINYRFRFADKDNIYIGQREGSTYIPPTGKFAIFEPAVGVGNSIPVFTSFEFTENPVWVQVPQNKVDQLKVLVLDRKLENETTSPILTATVKNSSLFRIPEVSFVVILYDALGNAVSVSHTYLDVLLGEESKVISFTWPEPFKDKVVSSEIIPVFNIFSVKLPS